MSNIILHICIVFFICSLSPLCVGSPIQDLPTSMKQKKCRVNICYAIDGSRSISSSEYQKQVNFVADTVNFFSGFSNKYFGFAAAQYGSKAYQISPLTPDLSYLVRAMEKSKPVQDGITNIAAGLRYCTNQLSRSPAELKVIVLLGDGRNSGNEDPVQVADSFRKSGGTVISVGVGNVDLNTMIKLSGPKEGYYSVYVYLRVGRRIASIAADKCRS